MHGRLCSVTCDRLFSTLHFAESLAVSYSFGDDIFLTNGNALLFFSFFFSLTRPVPPQLNRGETNTRGSITLFFLSTRRNDLHQVRLHEVCQTRDADRPG